MLTAMLTAAADCWLLSDSLEVGNCHRSSCIGPAEARAHFSLWCITSSPLYRLRSIDWYQNAMTPDSVLQCIAVLLWNLPMSSSVNSSAWNASVNSSVWNAVSVIMVVNTNTKQTASVIMVVNTDTKKTADCMIVQIPWDAA